jgi:hypothetical protein
MMRLNFRLKVKDLTYFTMLARTQTLQGVTSLQPDGKHILMWDLENCTLQQAEETLRKVQYEHSLSHIYITSDAEKSFRAWCFSHVDWRTYIKILLNTEHVDWNFIHWTLVRGKATLRTSSKKDRLPQKCVSVLKSFPHPFPERTEEVIYDTGTQKEGINILLDVLTEEHVFWLRLKGVGKRGFSFKLGR